MVYYTAMSGCPDALDETLTPFDRIVVKECDKQVKDSPAVLAAITELELELNLELRSRPSTPTNIPLEYQSRTPSTLESRTSAQSHAGRSRSSISSFQSGVAQLDSSVFYTHE